MLSYDKSDVLSANGTSFLKLESECPILQPEVLLVQFSGSRRGNDAIDAEKRLRCAVLEDALRCFVGNLGAQNSTKRRRRTPIDSRLPTVSKFCVRTPVTSADTSGIDRQPRDSRTADYELEIAEVRAAQRL